MGFLVEREGLCWVHTKLRGARARGRPRLSWGHSFQEGWSRAWRLPHGQTWMLVS